MTHPAASIQIIRATPHHIELVAPLFDAYRQFYKQPSDVAHARQFVLERLTNAESVLFVAVTTMNDHHGLGFTQLYPSFSSVSMKRLWILNDLFVMPDTRGRGVARALLEQARTFAQETHAKGLTLATATDNVTAQRLYEQIGYRKDEQFYHYFLNL